MAALLDRPAAGPAVDDARAERAAGFGERIYRHRWFPFGVMLAGAVLVLHAAWIHPTGAIVSDSADAMEGAWFLRWTPYALTHGLNPLFTDYIVHPAGANLAWNTTVPLAGIALTPITLLLGPVFSLNLLLTVEIALTGWCGYLACSRYVTSRGAALLGGAIVGFGPFEITQVGVGHMQTAAGMFPSLVLLLLDDILVRRRRSPWLLGAALGALSAIQLYLWEETLAATAIVAAIGVAALAVMNRDRLREPAERLAKALLAGTAPFLALAAPLLLYEFRGPLVLHGSVLPAGAGDGDALNLLLPNRFTDVAYPKTIESAVSPLGFEPSLYLGVPLLAVLVGITCLMWRRTDVRVFSMLLAGSVLLALGGRLHIGGHDTGIPLPWGAISSLPLLVNLLPVRFTLFTDLFAALLVVIALDASRTLRVRDTRNAARLAIGVSAFALLPALTLPAKGLDDPYVFQTAAASRIPEGAVVLVAPVAGDITDPHGVTVEPMLWQAMEGMRFRMPEGYVRHPTSTGIPTTGPDTTPLLDAMVLIDQSGVAPPQDPSLRERFREELRGWSVGMVIVGPMRYQSTMRTFVGWLTGDRGTLDGNVYVYTSSA